MTEQKEIAGKYTIIAELGRGGMGVVYKAEQTALGRRVAVKVLSQELARDEEFLRRFQQEAKVVARMGSHDNIVQVYDVEQYEGAWHIVMEFVEGGSLGDRMKKGETFDRIQSIGILRQVLRALAHAHKHGIVHRDIKPDNIMITNQGKVKVMDFGIARVQDGGDVRTQTGISIGTPHYMSPEQIEGRRDLDARADLYSVAVLMFYMMTGKLPFDEDNAFALAMKHVTTAPPVPSQVNPEVDGHLEQLILHGLEKDPNNRFQTANEMQQALRAYLHDQGVNSTQSVGGATEDSYQDLTEDVRMALEGADSDATNVLDASSNPFQAQTKKPISTGFHGRTTRPQASADRRRAIAATSAAGVQTAPVGQRGVATQPGVDDGSTNAIPAGEAPTIAAPARPRSAPAAQKKSGGFFKMALLFGLFLLVLVGGGGAAAIFLAPEPTGNILKELGVDLTDQGWWPGEKGDGEDSDGSSGPAPAPTPTPEATVAVATPTQPPAVVATPIQTPNDRTVVVATPRSPTPTPQQEPAPATLQKLERTFTDLAYDDVALRNFSFDLTREVARFPRSQRLKNLEANLAKRQDESLKFTAFKAKVDNYIANDRLSDARKLVEAEGPAFSLRDPVSDLEGKLITAEIEYGDKTQQTIEALMDNSQLNEARRVLARALIEAPSDPRWKPLADRLTSAEKDQADVEAELELIQKRGEAILEAIRAGEAIKARGLFEDLQADMPRADLTALKGQIRRETQSMIVRLERLGLQARRENRPEAALELYNRALAFEPDNAMLKEQRAELEKIIDQQERADKLFETAVASRQGGDLVMAKVTLEQLLDLDPTHTKAKEMLVDVLGALSKDQFTGPRITDSDEIIRRRKRTAPKGMVYIPGGFYTIGRDDGPAEEGPRHVKKVEGFYIGMREISLREYDGYIKTHSRGKSRPFIIKGTSLDRPDMPVVGISYLDAKAYAESKGMRLPTETEWEVAARTIAGWKYPWGDKFSQKRVNAAGGADGYINAAPVNKGFRESPSQGGYADGTRSTWNMGGNVSEWTESYFDQYPGNNTIHPRYGKTRYRVVRGGSYLMREAEDFTATRREAEREATRNRKDLGFRLAADPR